jgi:aconitate hydratase
MYLGVKVVLAKSFERIHAAILVNAGIIPFTFTTGSDYEIGGIPKKSKRAMRLSFQI